MDDFCCFRSFRGLRKRRNKGLLTNTEFFDDSTVTLDVFTFEVVEHTTTLTNECGQGALGTEVLAIVLEVLGEVVDTEGEERNLALCATGVLGVFAVLSEELSFFLRS